jgi:hypothetical protein
MAAFLTAKPDLSQPNYGYEGLDGDLERLSFADPVPEPLENLRPRRIFGGGALVSPVNMPTKLRLEGPKRRLPEFGNAAHMFMVTRRVVDLVLGFQKEIQYFPVECFWADGTSAGEFFLLFTTVLLDAVNREQTTVTWRVSHSGRGYWTMKRGEKFAFDKARLGNTHMWVDPNMAPPHALITDALYDALREAKVESFHDSGNHPEL